MQVSEEYVTDTNGGAVRTASDPTYLHSGRTAATHLAPSASIELFPRLSDVIALMVDGKVGHRIFSIFVHLLALGNGSSESFDAGHVRYPFTFVLVPILPKAIVAHV